MKKKKIIRIPLIAISVSAITTAIPFAAGLSEIGVQEVQASTSGKTREQAIEWAKSQVNIGKDYDGFAGVQCTDLIQMYANYLGQYLPAVGASKYATANLPSGWKRYNNNTVPQSGDIFIYDGNTYGAYGAGHVGIILEVNSDGYKCIEYNWSNQLYGAIRYVNGQRSFSYIIRPDFPTARISPGKPASIPAGYYIINSAVGNKFLDVEGNSKADNANIRMLSPTGKSGQIFYIGKNQKNTGYNMRNLSGKYVQTDTNTPGMHNVKQYKYSDMDGQNWLFEDAGNGYVYARNFFNYYLDVDNSKNDEGTNVKVYGYNGSNAQKWKYTKVSGKEKTKISSGNYIIRSKIGNKVLDVGGGSLNSGAALDIYTQNNTGAQIFNIGWNNAIGANYITNVRSNKLVDTPNANTMGNAIQSDKTMNKTQTWFFEDAGGGYYYIRNLWGYYLDVAYGKNADGTKVNVWEFTGDDKQKWKIEKATTATGLYSDVTDPGSWYFNAVYWATVNGIATGSDGSFLPAENCTREQAITFLWRMAGKPAPKNMKSAYSDVKDSSRYSYKAIMWGTEKGIITGSKGMFYPQGVCTREQIVTMLWRSAGKPSPKNMYSSFYDVYDSSRYSYKAILWAQENGIATGTNNEFAPEGQCKRRDIVTFIYRYKNR